MAGRYQEALDLSRSVQQLYPDNSETKWMIGMAHYQLKNYEQAEVFFREATELSEQIDDQTAAAIAAFNLGRAYEKLTDFDHARRKYLDALSQEPTYLLAREALERLERRVANQH